MIANIYHISSITLVLEELLSDIPKNEYRIIMKDQCNNNGIVNHVTVKFFPIFSYSATSIINTNNDYKKACS